MKLTSVFLANWAIAVVGLSLSLTTASLVQASNTQTLSPITAQQSSKPKPSPKPSPSPSPSPDPHQGHPPGHTNH